MTDAKPTEPAASDPTDGDWVWDESSDATEDFAELLAECHDDPDLFNSAALGRSDFWWAQELMARSVVDHRVTVVYSGNAIGKDFFVAGIIPWWLWTRPDSLVIVTGPGQTLLGSVTWKEVRRANRNSLLPFECHISEGVKTSPHTVVLEDGWQALGYSTSSIERASGQHAEHLLVVVEEASGVDPDVWDAIDSLKFDRLVAIGNPIRSEGRFIDLIRQAERDRIEEIPPHLAVNAIQIPSTDSPHAHLEKSPFGLADQTWLNDGFRRYGKDSLWCASHIFAKIPDVSSECLIPEAWLDACTGVVRGSVGKPILPRMAIDLGEGIGRDSTVILVRDELGILEVTCSNTLGLAGAANEAHRLMVRWNVPEVRISFDKLGIGKDFPHHLLRVGIKGAMPYSGEGSPQKKQEFTNLRTEAAWRLRQRLNPGWEPDLTIPQSRTLFHIPPATWWQRLRTELKVLDYCLAGRKTALLKKDDWCTRLGHSPDIADALIQSFAF